MARLSDWIDLQERLMAIPAKVSLALRQCLEEVVVNLIDHTPPKDRKAIRIELGWHGDTLVAAVEDAGPPFDLTAVPEPARPASLEDAVPGGWGIPLIRAFATDIRYETSVGRNRLTLRFGRSGR